MLSLCHRTQTEREFMWIEPQGGSEEEKGVANHKQRRLLTWITSKRLIPGKNGVTGGKKGTAWKGATSLLHQDSFFPS